MDLNRGVLGAEGDKVASQHECEQALRALSARLYEVDPAIRAKYTPRTLACRISDLQITFRGLLTPEGVEDLTCQPLLDGGHAQLRATASSEDLIALVEGRLSVSSAWATGRLKIEAGVLDLLRLRSLL